jgi:NAD(P)-dependent dehydrogenase (short-subunit alcohol dehydrogenase family)
VKAKGASRRRKRPTIIPPAGAPQTGRLQDKVAVITGASRGIGLAIAQALAREGCLLAMNARHAAALKAAASRIQGSAPVLALACDVGNERSIRRFFAAVEKRFGRVDILVNNAGISHPLRNIEEMPLATWRQVVETNLTGMFLCTRAALPLMRAGGTIVNNLSLAAHAVFAGEAAYCASKHGALGFTGTLREEVRERGIRVLALMPGATDTDIWQQFWPDAPRQSMMWPETVAQAVLLALTLPENAAVEEIRMGPTAGAL